MMYRETSYSSGSRESTHATELFSSILAVPLLLLLPFCVRALLLPRRQGVLRAGDEALLDSLVCEPGRPATPQPHSLVSAGVS